MKAAVENPGESPVDGRGRSPGSRRTQYRRGPDPRRAVRKRQPSGRVPWMMKAMRRLLDRPASKDRLPAEKTCRKLLEETVAKLEKARANAERPEPLPCGRCKECGGRSGNRWRACGQCQDAFNAWESERRAWGVANGPRVQSPGSNAKPAAFPPPVRQHGRRPKRLRTQQVKTHQTPSQDRAAIEARIRSGYDYSGNC